MLRTILSAIVGPVMLKAIERWGWKAPLLVVFGLAGLGALVWLVILYHNLDLKRCNTEFEYKLLQKKFQQLQKNYENLRHLYHKKHSKNDTKKPKHAVSWLPFQTPYPALRDKFSTIGAFAYPFAVFRGRVVLFSGE